MGYIGTFRHLAGYIIGYIDTFRHLAGYSDAAQLAVPLVQRSIIT